MRTRRITALAALCAMALLAGPARADRVILSNGSERIGLVKENPNDPGSIIFTDHRGTVTIPRSRIEKIVAEAPYVAHLEIGDGYFKNGSIDKAVESYKQAEALGAPADLVKARIDTARQTQTKRADEARSQALGQIDQLLLDGAEQVKQGQFAKAADIYAKAQALDPSDDQKKALARRLIDLHMAWGKSDLDRVNPVGAAAHFEQVRKWDPANEEALRLLIETRKKDPAYRQDVADYYQRELDKNPADSAVRRELAEALFSLNRHGEALPHFLALFDAKENPPRDLRARVEACYQTLHEAAAAKGDYAGAANIYREYLGRFKDADKTMLSNYEYAEQRNQIMTETISTTDPARLDRLANLGFWCRNHGLHEKAKKEFTYVLSLAPDNDLAKQGMFVYAGESLTKAQAAFAQRDYNEAIRLANATIADYPGFIQLVTAATELKEKSNNELLRQQQAKRAEAIKWADQGDDYYAQAQTYIGQARDTQVSRRTTTISDIREADRFLLRAIDAWQQALKIDPTLGAKTERNLYEKIADANRLRTQLMRDRPLPSKERNPASPDRTTTTD